MALLDAPDQLERLALPLPSLHHHKRGGQGGAPRPHRPPPSAFGARLSDIVVFQAAILIDMHRNLPRLGEYPPPYGTLKLPALDLERPDNSLLGRYHFSLPEAIARGDFRPLRDPAEFDDEDALIYAAATEDL